jgi:hypothetical protein
MAETATAPPAGASPPSPPRAPASDPPAAGGLAGRLVRLAARRGGRNGGPTALLATLGALFWGQVLLLTAPERDPAQTLVLALKAGLGVWVLLTLLGVGFDLIGPRSPSAATATGGRRTARSLLAPLALVGGTVLLIAVLTAPATGRLAATALCYLILATALGWLVWRRAGPEAATRALAALSLFVAVAAAADVRAAPRIEESSPDSAYRWVAGWPGDGWVLRHEMRPLTSLPARAMTLAVPLAAPYDGPAKVYVTANGRDLGPASVVDRRRLYVDVPADLVAGAERLEFDLRQRPADPRMRISAGRFGDAATAGPNASSYFDGRRWWPGTFDDARGVPRSGIYIVQLDSR